MAIYAKNSIYGRRYGRRVISEYNRKPDTENLLRITAHHNLRVTARHMLNRAESLASFGHGNIFEILMTQKYIDREGGFSAAGIDEKKFKEISHTGIVNRAREEFDSAESLLTTYGIKARDNSLFIHIIDCLQKHTDQAGGLAAVRLTQKQWVKLVGKPYHAPASHCSDVVALPTRDETLFLRIANRPPKAQP